MTKLLLRTKTGNRLFYALILCSTFGGGFGPIEYASSKEVDSFTRRNELLSMPEMSPSSIDALSSMTNKLMEKAINDANAKHKGCNEEVLLAKVKDSLAGKKVLNVEAAYGAVEEIVDTGKNEHTADKFNSLPVEKSKSIYRDYKATEATFLKSVASIIRVDDYVVGADKFGHFFGQGYTYFNIKKKKGLQAALKFGDYSEKGNMGWGVTGVYSYGDLAANYEGMRFWERLLSPQGGQEPYILCKDGQWTKNEKAPFNWKDYINPAWDEGLNCNVYRNQTLTNKVNLEIIKLEKDQNVNLTCPISMEKCEEMIDHYGEIAPAIVGPSCHEAVKNKVVSHPTEEDVIHDLQCSKAFSRKSKETMEYLRYFFKGTVKEMFRSFGHGITKKSKRSAAKIGGLFSVKNKKGND